MIPQCMSNILSAKNKAVLPYRNHTVKIVEFVVTKIQVASPYHNHIVKVVEFTTIEIYSDSIVKVVSLVATEIEAA